MLRYVLFDTTMFGPGQSRAETEHDIMWLLQALCTRNQSYLKEHPNTPRLYKSGVNWSAPKQLTGDVDEVKILKKHLGVAMRSPDVQRVLEKIQDVLGGEHFCDIGRILELGEIDCDGLACWRVAELRQMGIQAEPCMTSRERPGGGTTYHALVAWPPMGPYNYETSEDPSLLLGMYQPERAADRLEEIRKNNERLDILRKYGRSSLRPTRGAAKAALETVSFEEAVNELLGRGKKVA